jgi:phosphatidylinositol-3-phosphatase
MRRRLVRVFLAASLPLFAGPTMLAAAPGSSAVSVSSGAEGVPSFGHVFVIIGENTELGQLNKSNSPYLLNQVKPQSAWLTSYFALTHFSEANYVGMTSGQYTRCQQFDGSAEACHQDVDNLFHQLDVAGVSWQSWMESMPAPCTLASTGSPRDLNHYGAKHNPAIFYDNIEGAGGVWSSTNPSTECLTKDIPTGGTGPNDMSTFDAALATGDVARFNYVVPNECEDGHDNCKPVGNSITQFDNFLAREVPKIMSSPAFGADGLLLITFDEGTSNRGDGNGHQFSGGGNIAFVALGPLVQPGVYGDTFDHFSLLRTLEDGYGITTYLANAAAAKPINNIWAN